MQERSNLGQFSPPLRPEGRLTEEYLKYLLRYDPETGLWFWVNHYHPKYIGRQAGTTNKHYVYMVIDKKRYLAHRLAFLYMTGKIPKLEIDHKDGVKNNNSWSNLREATPKQNMANRLATKRSKTGVKGVSYNKGNYQVNISLGCYKTLEEAKLVYDEAAKKLHGEFYRS